MASTGFDAASGDAPQTYRALFEARRETVAVVPSTRALTGAVLKALRGYVVAHRGVRAVLDDTTSGLRRILLCPDELVKQALADGAPVVHNVQQQFTTIDSLPQKVRQALRSALSAHREELAGTVLVPAAFDVGAQHQTMEEILRRLLPEGVVVPSGFEQIGHIAHLNLQAPQLPYRRLIGQVLLDQNRAGGVRTVVNKLEIGEQFRELKLDLIAGEPDFNALVKEHGVEFVVPFDKVYWNSRLSEEHRRLVASFAPQDELYDVMAGVGPFAVPALKRGLRVVANDLNPASVEAMRENVKRNFKRQTPRFTASCEDGRAFIRRIRRDVLAHGPPTTASPESAASSPAPPPTVTRHFAMNLPATAVEFLDAFNGSEWQDVAADGVVHDSTFLVHCYCFSRSSDPEAAAIDAVAQCSKHLGVPLDRSRDVSDVHVVRDVAPLKLMVCVSFRLPPAIFAGAALAKRTRTEGTEDGTSN